MNSTRLLILPLILFAALLHGQSIDNVKSYLSGNKVIVTYELTGGKFYNYYKISLYVSRDNGKSFEGPLKEVSGDVGVNIRRGSRQITWDAMKEIPFVDQSFVFDVRAEVFRDDLKPEFFISYVGNTSTPIGLRVGVVGKVGFYAETRLNTRAFNSPDYTYQDGEVIDYDLPGYYEFTDNKGYSDFSVLGGITYQSWRNIFLFAGVGYGWDRYLYEVTNYSYDNNEATGTYYVVHSDYDIKGFEIDAGIMYRYKWLLFSAGATTIGFQNVGWTGGVGIVF